MCPSYSSVCSFLSYTILNSGLYPLTLRCSWSAQSENTLCPMVNLELDALFSTMAASVLTKWANLKLNSSIVPYDLPYWDTYCMNSASREAEETLVIAAMINDFISNTT